MGDQIRTTRNGEKRHQNRWMDDIMIGSCIAGRIYRYK